MTIKTKAYLLEFIYFIIIIIACSTNPIEEELPQFFARLPMDYKIPILSNGDQNVSGEIMKFPENEILIPIQNNYLLTVSEMPDIIDNLSINFYNFSSDNYNKIDGQIYLEDVYNYLIKYAPEGMWISAALAQAYTEGGAGKDNGGVYSKTNNCFGIMAGPNWDGFVYSRTSGKVYKNYETAKKHGASDLFRAYLNMEESVKDYVDLIQTDRYKKALQQNSYKNYLKTIIDAGYCEDHIYNTWINVIKIFKLTKYDN